MNGAALALAIEQAIAADKQPLFIGLTAGTTVLGAYDPIKPAADIAKRYHLWLHIDGAWGGPALFSPQTAHLLADSHLADSFTWDAHKLMGVPMTASAILVNDPNDIERLLRWRWG